MKYSKRRKDMGEGFLGEDSKLRFITFDKALGMFLDSQDASNHSKATYNDYSRVLNLFLYYMHDKHSYTLIQQVTEQDIIGWLSFLRNTLSSRGRPYSSKSIETYARDVIAFFNWLVRHGHLESSPMAQIGLPKAEKTLIRVFTEQEIEMLDAACDRDLNGKALTQDERKALASRDRAILWFLLSTGVRASEACGLLFADIDWDKSLVYVRGKGAKERRIPFGKIARQHLNTYVTYWRGRSPESDEHVFLNSYGSPLTYTAVQQMFMRLKRVADIKDKRVSAHTCRHWFAVNCIKNGMPSTVLQGLLGHEKLEMINTYVRLADQDNRELYARFSPADNLEMHHRSKDKRKDLRDWRKSRNKKV